MELAISLTHCHSFEDINSQNLLTTNLNNKIMNDLQKKNSFKVTSYNKNIFLLEFIFINIEMYMKSKSNL